MEFVLPPLSVTVSVTVRVPVCGYVALMVFPVAVGSGNRPRSQLYETIVPSSVDDDASSWHVSVGQLHVKFATGGLSTGGGGGGGAVTVTDFVMALVCPALSVTVSVMLLVPAVV